MKPEGKLQRDTDGLRFSGIRRYLRYGFGVRRFGGALGRRDLSRWAGRLVARRESGDESPHSKAFTIATLGLLVLFLASCNAAADIPSGWRTNLTATLNSASNRPVLLYFTASWCGPCKMMQANTLPDPTVRSNLTNFACVALDLDANQVIARKYGVSAIPAFLILSATGDEVLRTEGFRDAAPFSTWLDKAKAAFAEAQEKAAAFVKQQADLELSLKSQDTAVRKAAMDELFKLCANREPSHQSYAAAQLKALAARDSKALLAGLEHPKLATRIAVANQLRDTLGDTFAFDPWTSSAIRIQAILALRSSSVWDEAAKKLEAEQKEQVRQ